MMEKSKFSLARKDERILKLIKKAGHKTLAVWAIDCAERVLPYFEEKYPDDPRPRNAIKTLQEWINTGVFKMAVIRGASLASHAQQAIHRASTPDAADAAAAKERDWRCHHLLELINTRKDKQQT